MIEIAETYQDFKRIEAKVLSEGYKFFDVSGRKMIYKKFVNGIEAVYKIHMHFWTHDK